ncbi:unnamed protein product [Pocillopora meandrina]|uniref:Uncharacterized protein n=1 Tax=Pocillopora meandrina TaxID=46732 RepID=A0AAU9Y535_9CNID|nr:unnamed protein product [Pocillopora meandrina]CAH3168774.1 unnamed protein product [Pocillopora meandrina]
MGRQGTSFFQSHVALIQLCAKKYNIMKEDIRKRRAVPRVNQLSNQLHERKGSEKERGPGNASVWVR